MNFITFFSQKRKKSQGIVMLAPGIMKKANTGNQIDNAIEALQRDIIGAMHGTPDSQEEKIRKVREDAQREIERKKRLSPIEESMKRGQLEERLWPKRPDPSTVKKYNRDLAMSMMQDLATNLYALIVHGRGIRSIEDLERKDLDPKHRAYLLKHILDAPTMEKLISAVWREEPEIRNLTGITQRQRIHETVSNVFI